MTQIWLQRGFTHFKRLLPRSVWQPLRSIATGLVTPIRFSTQSGHWKSSISMCARSASGAPIPWYTYPAIDFLSPRSFEGKKVLEFGGGQSTFWWSARASSVLTVEEDSDWYASLASKIGQNVSLHHIPVDHATRSIAPIRSLIESNSTKIFDIIIVDGHLRRELTALAFDYLSPDGAIILDNAEGYGFYDEVRNRDCRRIDFFGFAPGGSLRTCTSLVFVGDCFMLRPEIPIPDIESH
ncbi:Predicted O-methyltransferase YrrM [Rhizobiales bacterium GAS113]|nr:Predicted O-methyltransferase YrrM [Rhizobiales bacterium GAS113]